jgi:hypothetical protein
MDSWENTTSRRGIAATGGFAPESPGKKDCWI